VGFGHIVGHTWFHWQHARREERQRLATHLSRLVELDRETRAEAEGVPLPFDWAKRQGWTVKSVSLDDRWWLTIATEHGEHVRAWVADGHRHYAGHDARGADLSEDACRILLGAELANMAALLVSGPPAREPTALPGVTGAGWSATRISLGDYWWLHLEQRQSWEDLTEHRGSAAINAYMSSRSRVALLGHDRDGRFVNGTAGLDRHEFRELVRELRKQSPRRARDRSAR
jgi:hypothetical protein